MPLPMPPTYRRHLAQATHALFVALIALTAGTCQSSESGDAGVLRLSSRWLSVQIDGRTGKWSLQDKRSAVRWPTQGEADAPASERLQHGFSRVDAADDMVRLTADDGLAVVFRLVDGGRSLETAYEGKADGTVQILGDALAITDHEGGYVIVPCREGLLIPATRGVSFRRAFGTSDYEGCHMNMLGLAKQGSTLVVSWDDAYVTPQVESVETRQPGPGQRITTTLTLRRSAHAVRLTPLGQGDWNTIAAGYRRIAAHQGRVVTLADKIGREPHLELLMGASDFKLWTCLARRMNDESTQVESVKVHWSFDEAAAIAEHLRNDLGIDRCLFMLGGWTEGGYDCRHPDNLPANPECGGNAALAAAIRRIQRLGYVACLHDNYQDMYRDARSWDPAMIEKRPDGSLVKGGRWLGGRAYMVCAPKQVELAMRPQNLPAIQRLFAPWSYFIDTTYAVGPRECADPRHPIGRNDDIAWKIQLSDKARHLFGLFGSECGREWALPHSDFFEGLVGVAGRTFHNLKPESLGATVIPFFEMVYHDCQVCYGKYGYAADQAAPYVAHHVLCARPLNYHSIPDHLYWTQKVAPKAVTSDRACYARTDRGWSTGLHPLDAFVKTTHEVLGPLHRATAHQRLTHLEFVTDDKTVRRATYGQGAEATAVVVNFGHSDASTPTLRGGKVILPPWGFVAEGPRFTAFYAKRWGRRDYPDGALFAIRVAQGRDFDQASKIRIFHGFGDPQIDWRGRTHTVSREQIVQSP